jgi:uncharacterized membrane protein YjfL (UPF0719 family)
LDIQRFTGDLVLSIAWTFVSFILLFVAAWAFDRFHPIEFRRSISEGNVAAGIVLASIILALGIIIAALVRA